MRAVGRISRTNISDGDPIFDCIINFRGIIANNNHTEDSLTPATATGMIEAHDLFLGEWARAIDDRYRLSLPPEWVEPLAGESAGCTLAK